MKTLQYASEEYNVSTRTISRRMKEIEKTNPELIALYKEHANYLKTGEKISENTRIKIGQLRRRPVILSAITENREQELTETIRKFEELLAEGISKAEAARRLGYADYSTIWKKYQELERIKTEKKTKQGADHSNTFKESLKVNVKSTQSTQTIAGKETIEEMNYEETEIDD